MATETSSQEVLWATKNIFCQILYQVCHYTSVIGWFLFWMKGKIFLCRRVSCQTTFWALPFPHPHRIPQHFFSSPLFTPVFPIWSVSTRDKKRGGEDDQKFPFSFLPPLPSIFMGKRRVVGRRIFTGHLEPYISLPKIISAMLLLFDFFSTDIWGRKGTAWK